mgnify:CR=1 FL=1
MADMNIYFSPYSFAADNPVLFYDEMGEFPVSDVLYWIFYPTDATPEEPAERSRWEIRFNWLIENTSFSGRIMRDLEAGEQIVREAYNNHV